MKNKIIGILISLIFINCGSAQKSSDNINTYKGNTAKLTQSDEKIENGITYQIFFILNKPVKCINVKLSSIRYNAANEPQNLNSYFYIEKLVDISNFKIDKTRMFAQLGKNFDHNWSLQDCNICSEKNDPIRNLNKNIYRIRFTAFYRSNFNYVIDIKCPEKCDFSEKMPEIFIKK